MNTASTIYVLLLALILIGCSSNNTVPGNTAAELEATPQSLAGRWHIKSITDRDGKSESISPRAEWALYFSVDESTQMSSVWVGFGPCSGYSFDYMFSDNTFTRLGEFNHPDSSCAAIAEQQVPIEIGNTFNQMVIDSRTFTTDFTDGESLRLLTGFNELLHLKKEPLIAEKLFDRSWTLISARDESGSIQAVNQEENFEFTLHFSTTSTLLESGVERIRNTVVGMNVCNEFSTEYGSRGFLFSFYELASDGASCERAAETVSRLVSQTLNANGNLVVDLSGDTLTFETSTNILLVYKESEL